MNIEKVLTVLKMLEGKAGTNVTMYIEPDGSGSVVSWGDGHWPEATIEFDSIDDFYEQAISCSS